jgi:lysozyme
MGGGNDRGGSRLLCNSFSGDRRYNASCLPVLFTKVFTVKEMIQQSTIDFLKHEESVRYKAYRDVAGKLTIGVGHLILPNEHQQYDTALLQDKAVDDLLRHDLVTCDDTIRKYVKVPLTQNQYDAIASFIFNEGSGAFASSHLLQYINNHAPETVIKDAFMVWDKAVVNGHLVSVEGLKNRRTHEVNLYFK